MSYKNYYDGLWQAVVELILFIVSTIALCSLLANIYLAKKGQKLTHEWDVSLLKLTVIVLLGAFFYNLAFLIRRGGTVFLGMYPACGLDDFWVIFLAMSRIAQYNLFLVRLYYSLEKTAFGYNKNTLKTMAIVVSVIASILCLLYITFRLIGAAEESVLFGNDCENLEVPLGDMVFFMYIGFDTIMNIVLLCMYLKKYKLLRKTYLTVDNNDDENSQERVALASKLSVLVAAAQVSTWISFVGIFLNLEVGLVGLDLFVNSLCVYLCLEYNNSRFKSLCGSCENCCAKTCDKMNENQS